MHYAPKKCFFFGFVVKVIEECINVAAHCVVVLYCVTKQNKSNNKRFFMGQIALQGWKTKVMLKVYQNSPLEWQIPTCSRFLIH